MPEKNLSTVNNEIFRMYDGPYADKSYTFLSIMVINSNVASVMKIIDPELYQQREELRVDFENSVQANTDTDTYYGLTKARDKVKMNWLGGNPEKRRKLYLADEKMKQEFLAYKNSLTGADAACKGYLELIEAIAFPESGDYVTAYQDSFYVHHICGLIATGLKLSKKTVNGKDVVDFESLKTNLSKPDGRGYFAPYMAMCEDGAKLIRLETEIVKKKRIGWKPGEEKEYLERLAALQTSYIQHFQELRTAVNDNPHIYDAYLENEADHETGWNVLGNKRNQITSCAHMSGQAQAVQMGWAQDELPVLGYIGEMEAMLGRLREQHRLQNEKDDGPVDNSKRLEEIDKRLSDIAKKIEENKKKAVALNKMQPIPEDYQVRFGELLDAINELNEQKEALDAEKENIQNRDLLALRTKQAQDGLAGLKNKIWNRQVRTLADKKAVLEEIEAFHTNYGELIIEKPHVTLNGYYKEGESYGRFFDGIKNKLTIGIDDEVGAYPEEKRKIDAFRRNFGVQKNDLPFTEVEMAFLAATGISGIEEAVSRGTDDLDTFVGANTDKINQGKNQAEVVANAYANGNKKLVAEMIHKSFRASQRRFKGHFNPATGAAYNYSLMKAFTGLLMKDEELAAAFREINQARPQAERVDMDSVFASLRVAKRSLGKIDLHEIWTAAGQEMNDQQIPDKEWFRLRDERSRAGRKLRYIVGLEVLTKESGISRLHGAMDYVGSEEGMLEYEKLLDRLQEEQGLAVMPGGNAFTVRGTPFLEHPACRDAFEIFMTQAANKGILQRLEKGDFAEDELRSMTRAYMMNLFRLEKMSFRQNTGVESEYLKTDPETEIANMHKHLAVESSIMGYVNSFEFTGITGEELAQNLRNEAEFFKKAMLHMEALVDNNLWSNPKKRNKTELSSIHEAVTVLERANHGFFISTQEYKDILKDLTDLEKDLAQAEKEFRQEKNWQYDGAGLAAREKALMNRLSAYITRKNEELNHEDSRTAIKRRDAANRAMDVLRTRYEQDRKLPTVTKENLAAARSFEAYGRLSVEESNAAKENLKPIPHVPAKQEAPKQVEKAQPQSKEKLEKRLETYKSFRKRHSRDREVNDLFYLLNETIPAASDTTPLTEMKLGSLKFIYTGAIRLMTRRINDLEKKLDQLPRMKQEYEQLTKLKNNPTELAKLSPEKQEEARLKFTNTLPFMKDLIAKLDVKKKEQDEYIKIRKTLSKDLKTINNCLKNGKRPTGAALFEDARSFRMTYDLSAAEAMGGNLSERIPITLKDGKGKDILGTDGKPMKGFFTVSKPVESDKDLYAKLKQQVIDEYGEAGRIVEDENIRKAAIYVGGEKDFRKDFLLNPARTFVKICDDVTAWDVVDKLKRHLEKSFEQWKVPNDQRQPIRDALGGINTAEKARAFVDYMHGLKKISNADAVKQDIGIKKGDIVDKRNSAASLVAELIGCPDIIANSRNLQVRKNGKGKATIGTFMAYAKGHDLGSLKHEDMELFNQMTPAKMEGNLQLKKDIANLQILDFLIGNPDRHLLNMFYKFDENGRLVGIQGIDNDTSFGKLRHDKHLEGINLENLAVVTKETADALVALRDNKELYKNMLYGFRLGDDEVDAAVKRLDDLVDKIQLDAPAFEGKIPEELIDGKIRIMNDDEMGKIPFFGGLDSGEVMKKQGAPKQGRKQKNMFASLASLGNGGNNLSSNEGLLINDAFRDNAEYVRGAKRLGRLMKEMEEVDGRNQRGSTNFTNMRNAVIAYQQSIVQLDYELVRKGRNGFAFYGNVDHEVPRIDSVIQKCDTYINGKNAEEMKKLSPDNRTFKRYQLALKCKAEMEKLKKLYIGMDEKIERSYGYGNRVDEMMDFCNAERDRLTNEAKANIERAKERQAADLLAIQQQANRNQQANPNPQVNQNQQANPNPQANQNPQVNPNPQANQNPQVNKNSQAKSRKLSENKQPGPRMSGK